MSKNLRIFITAAAAVICAAVIFSLLFFNIIPQRTYKASHFGIETYKSSVDFNNNGTDDCTDILLGARKDAKNHPTYKSEYYADAYPPDNIGVCTDVIWRAFKNAGYNLRDMINADIAAHPKDYPAVSEPDVNIDFRRVKNLDVFFKKYAISLTTDINDIAEWQPGDIVIFGNNTHIGIISDKRTKDGITYVIHNGGQPNREENYFKRAMPTAHYRFNAELIDKNILK